MWPKLVLQQDRHFLTSQGFRTIRKKYSGKFVVESGTPQGSVVSPLLFSIIISDVFMGMKNGRGFSLFADDGAIWKRGDRQQAHLSKKYIISSIRDLRPLSTGAFKTTAALQVETAP